MKIKELMEKRAALAAKVNEYQAKDKLTTEERAAVTTTLDEIKAIEADVVLQQRMDAANRRPVSEVVKDEKRNYSVRNLAMHMLGEKVDAGFELEVAQEVSKRSAGAGGTMIPLERRNTTAVGSIGSTIATDIAQPLPYLYPQTAFSQLGCTEIGGLVGDFEIPYSTTAIQGTGKGETAASDQITMSFGALKMTPHRLPVEVRVSRQSLIQNPSIEAFIQNEIRTGMRAKMEYYGLQGANTNGNPLGLLNYTINSVSNSTSWTYANALTALNNVFANNGGMDASFGTIIHPTAAAFVEAKDVSTSTGRFVIQDGRMVGFPVAKSTNAASTGAGMLVFGDWRAFNLLTWGGMDLIVDAVSLASTGYVKLIATAFYDVGTARPLFFTKNATTISA
jgi:HK97 family phage major capsid protein